MDIFKKASQQKLRFLTSKGSLSVEQLWDLPVIDLERCIRAVKKTLKASDDTDLGFLDDTNKVDPTNQLAFDVLKDVYITKKAENEAARNAKEQKENKEKILGLIKEKKEGALKEKSVEELEEMYSKL